MDVFKTLGINVDNTEIDPEERQAAKDNHKKKQAKIGKLIADHDTKLELVESSKVDPVKMYKTDDEMDTDSGFGSGNLASILASQSSSREILRKKKGKK